MCIDLSWWSGSQWWRMQRCESISQHFPQPKFTSAWYLICTTKCYNMDWSMLVQSVYSVLTPAAQARNKQYYVHRDWCWCLWMDSKLTWLSKMHSDLKCFLFNVMLPTVVMTNAFEWNEIEMCYSLALSVCSQCKFSNCFIYFIWIFGHATRFNLLYHLDAEQCVCVRVVCRDCAVSVVFIKCRCWFDIDIIRLSCRPKNNANCDFALSFVVGRTIHPTRQDVSINSIKPRSHTTAAAIKLSWIIYSPRI